MRSVSIEIFSSLYYYTSLLFLHIFIYVLGRYRKNINVYAICKYFYMCIFNRYIFLKILIIFWKYIIKGFYRIWITRGRNFWLEAIAFWMHLCIMYIIIYITAATAKNALYALKNVKKEKKSRLIYIFLTSEYRFFECFTLSILYIYIYNTRVHSLYIYIYYFISWCILYNLFRHANVPII